MSQDKEFEGRDLDEALGTAAADLGIAEDDLHYEVLEQGRRGLLGLGTRNVRIRVKPPIEHLSNEQILKGEDVAPRETRPPRPPRAPEPIDADEEESPRPARKASMPMPESARDLLQTVQHMLDLSGLDLKAEAEADEQGIVLRFEGDDRPLMKQRRGELAEAYQFLLNRMARRAWPEIGRIIIASDGGVEQRDDRLVSMARSAAKQVSRTGRTKRLRPMNAYERRLVHLAVREFPGLTSTSDGDGSLKSVRISKIRNEMEVRRSTT